MSKFRTIIGASAGNIAEWYDFAIYGFMAPYIAANFFPGVSHWLGVVATFLVFAVSFVGRPIGAAIYGHYGDTLGRRGSLVFSIIFMGLATFVIGLIPGSRTIGFWSVVILVVLRFLQGVSAGGEFGGSVTYLVESAPVLKRGFYGGIAMAAAIGGMLLASVIATIVSHYCSHQQMIDWAWRIPFFFSMVVMLVGLIFRLMMHETPIFEGLKETNFLKTSPIKDTVMSNALRVLKVALTVSLGAVISYLVLVFLPTYLVVHRGYSQSFTLLISSVSFLLVILSCLLTGYYGSFVSRRRILIAMSVLTVILAWPMGCAFQYGSHSEMVISQFVAAIIEGVSFGALMAYLTELFPAVLRFTALSLGYNLGYAIFGGFVPAIASYLIHVTNAEVTFTAVLAFIGVVSLLGLISFKKPTVVFIPGLCFGKDLFKYQYSYFRDAFHCQHYIIDSSKLEQCVHSILNQVKAKHFSIVAHSSLGAGVALATAAVGKDRVDHVVCFPGWVKPNQYMQSFMKETIEMIRQGDFDEFKKNLRSVAVGEDVKSRERVLQEIHAIQDEVHENDGIQQCMLLKDGLDITEYLPEIEAEVLVVRNMEGDPWFSEEDAIALSSALKKGQTITIENSGHIANYTSPKEANTLVEVWVRV